ncbi:hypothetical protein EDC01DRAFT_731692 [Geopyxis carbonaria]|nr:hypothetical protein EDC01DRAFT_731692 [Geopyxis carbonaria]
MKHSDTANQTACLLCVPNRGQCVRHTVALGAAEISKHEARQKNQRRRPQKHITLVVVPAPQKLEEKCDDAERILREGNRLFQFAAMNEDGDIGDAVLLSGNLGAVEQTETGEFRLLNYERVTSMRGESAWRRFLGVMVAENRRMIISGDARKKWWGRFSSHERFERERVFVDNVVERLKEGGGFDTYETKTNLVFEVWRVTVLTNTISGVSIIPYTGRKETMQWISKTEGFIEPPGTTMRYLTRKVEDNFPGSWAMAEEDIRKSTDSGDTQVGSAQFFGKKTIVRSMESLSIRNTIEAE